MREQIVEWDSSIARKLCDFTCQLFLFFLCLVCFLHCLSILSKKVEGGIYNMWSRGLSLPIAKSIPHLREGCCLHKETLKRGQNFNHILLIPYCCILGNSRTKL